MHRKRRSASAFAFWMIALAAVPFWARAWDVEDGAAAPGVHGRLSNGLHIDHLDVVIHDRSVVLNYEGHHHAPTSRATVLYRQSPPFGWQGVAADYPDLHFPEMKLWLNGQSLPSKHRVTAWFEGKDMAAALRRAGVDPLLPASAEDALMDGASLHPLRIQRMFSATSKNAPMAYPLWEVGYSQFWRVPRLPNGAVSIQLRYQARPSKREVETDSKAFAAAIIDHCCDLENVRSLLKGDDGTVPATVVMLSITVPLQLANLNEAETALTVKPSAITTLGLPLSVVLACGPDEASLMNQRFLLRSKVASGASLTVLEIYRQS